MCGSHVFRESNFRCNPVEKREVSAAYTSILSAQVSGFEDSGSSPSMTVSYAISVRRVSILPAASFRFHLAMDTLAVRLAVPLVGPAEDFHLQVTRQAPHLPGWCSRTTRPAGRTNKGKSPCGVCPQGLDFLARPQGFEPRAVCLEGRCSIRLSYGRVNKKLYVKVRNMVKVLGGAVFDDLFPYNTRRSGSLARYGSGRFCRSQGTQCDGSVNIWFCFAEKHDKVSKKTPVRPGLADASRCNPPF